MDCPRCMQPMQERQGAWACAEHGMLITAEAMETKHMVHRRLAKAHGTIPTFPCPQCQQTMMLVHPKGVDVDVCPCGALWLDKGEEKLMRDRHGEGWWLLLEPFLWLGLLFGAG